MGPFYSCAQLSVFWREVFDAVKQTITQNSVAALFIYPCPVQSCCPLMCILTSYLFSSNLSSRNSVTMR